MFALPGEKRPRGPEQENPDEPKKKKYAKEAWPGRKHGPAQGLFWTQHMLMPVIPQVCLVSKDDEITNT